MSAAAATRKTFTTIFVPTVAVGSTFATKNVNTTSADASAKNGVDSTSASVLSQASQRLHNKKIANVKTRMTAIGKFSLKTETPTNPSVPVFFLALSDPSTSTSISSTNKNNGDGNVKHEYPREQFGNQPNFTTSEFKQVWLDRKIHEKHPRFHSKVTPDGTYFEPTSTPTPTSVQSKANSNYAAPVPTTIDLNLDNHVSETLHMNVYRQDLKSRVEQLVSSAMDVHKKLWEVQISSGDLGSSGAISRKRAKDIQDNDKDGKNAYAPKQETVLLFRSHHALGDAVSLMAALGDLLDEADEIRDKIKAELKRRRNNKQNKNALQKIFAFLQKLIWFLFGSIQAIARQGYLMATTSQNPFLAVMDKTQQEMDELAQLLGRSVSWCDVAPVEEVKRVANILGDGKKVTVNDIFVSCVTKAVARQLDQHRMDAANTNTLTQSSRKEANVQHRFNVVIPAHLAGGILPPGRSVGNLIGAFVSSVPGESILQKDGSNGPLMPSERLALVHGALDVVKRSPAPFLSYCFARFVSHWLPQSVATRMFHRSSANAAVAITNSRGYEEKVHINGLKVESMAGFIPLPPGLPVGVVIQSYGSKISLSVNAEKWAVPDADQFLGWVIEEYQLLCKEAALKK